MTPFHPLDLEALFGLELPEPAWLVDDIVPLGAATLLSAREKAGKGFLTIDLCASVALEEPFLERAVKSGPAIYCAAEENLRDVRHRIERRIGSERRAPLHVLPLAGFTDDRLDLSDGESLTRLRDMIVSIRPLLVVIDTLREVHTGQEDKSDDMGPLLRPLRLLSHTYNVSIMVNHHMSKAGGSRGSTAIPAAFDHILTFVREDDGGKPVAEIRGVLSIDGRYAPRQSLPIVLGDDLRWKPTMDRVALSEPTTRDRVRQLIDNQDEGLTSKEIAESLRMDHKTVQNVLSTMKKEVPIPFVMTRTEGKGHACRFFPLQRELFPPGEHPLGEAGSGNDRLSFVPSRAGNGGNEVGNEDDVQEGIVA